MPTLVFIDNDITNDISIGTKKKLLQTQQAVNIYIYIMVTKYINLTDRNNFFFYTLGHLGQLGS